MDIYAKVRSGIAAGISGHTEADVRIPARHAACSIYAPEIIAVLPDAFPAMLGVPAVRTVTPKNGWLLFAFTDAFYDACVLETCAALPEPTEDGGSYALNRMLTLARQAGEGCPHNADIQRALWLMLGAAYGHTSADEAARAVLRMLHPLPPQVRMEARRTCGGVASACARLYARALGQ